MARVRPGRHDARPPPRQRALSLVRGTAGDGAVVALNAEAAKAETEIPKEGRGHEVRTGIGIVMALLGIAMGADDGGHERDGRPQRPRHPLVLVGTLGATIAACGLPAHIKLPKLYMKACMPEDLDLVGRVNELVGYAEKARRDGLLALDEAVKAIEDPFTKKGIQIVVDGTDPDLVAAVLDAENEAMRKRHKDGAPPFMQAGALAPTMAIFGTVFGLVNVMNNLNQPSRSATSSPARCSPP